MIENLFANGRVVDIVLLLTCAEAIALAAYHRRTGRGVAPVRLAGMLLAGGCLMLAVRCALTGAWWGWIALCLLGALAAHVADLRSRWHA